MPFYFAFQNRKMKEKVRRSLSFGNKAKKKSRNRAEPSFEGSHSRHWSERSDVVENCDGNPSPRRHSLESSVWDRSCSPLALLTPPLKDRRSSAPPKPPRMMAKKVFTCESPECRKTEELLGMIAINLKACPACFTHYCSTKCRVAHWPEHKRVCHYGRMTSYMRTIAEICQDEEDVRQLLSSIASSGYSDKGRGCVMLIFASPNAARLFIEEKVGRKPTYSSLGQLERLGVKNEHRKNLMKLISNYDPEFELVLNVAIVAERDLPPEPAPRNREPCVIDQFIVSLKDRGESKLNDSSRRLSL